MLIEIDYLRNHGYKHQRHAQIPGNLVGLSTGRADGLHCVYRQSRTQVGDDRWEPGQLPVLHDRDDHVGCLPAWFDFECVGELGVHRCYLALQHQLQCDERAAFL